MISVSGKQMSRVFVLNCRPNNSLKPSPRRGSLNSGARRKTMRIRTLPWPDVVSFYGELVHAHSWHIEPMLELVQFVAGSPYAPGLFPYTSHDRLCLGRTADFTAGDGELQIQFNPGAQSFTFTYCQSPADSSPWSRKCSAEEWRPVLERILQKRLGWFHGTIAA